MVVLVAEVVIVKEDPDENRCQKNAAECNLGGQGHGLAGFLIPVIEIEVADTGGDNKQLADHHHDARVMFRIPYIEEHGDIKRERSNLAPNRFKRQGAILFEQRDGKDEIEDVAQGKGDEARAEHGGEELIRIPG